MGSTIVDGPEVYEDRDPAQRSGGSEVIHGLLRIPIAGLLSTKKNRSVVPVDTLRESKCMSVTRTGQRTLLGLCFSTHIT